MLASLQAAPADPILGLAEAFRADPSPDKINLAVGVYKDAEGRTPVLRAVRDAERRLLEADATKAYLPIDGPLPFATQTQRLLLGDALSELDGDADGQSGRIRTAATPGGTGALRLAADFLHDGFPDATVWMPDPTWANHGGVLGAAGVRTANYRYLDGETQGFDSDGALADIAQAKPNDLILLHACCHNPTGVDPTPAQWQQIADAVNAAGAVPFVDFAYQGFGEDVDADAEGLRVIARTCPEVLIASSYSKNFGLYQDRVGALTLQARSADDAQAAWSRVKQAARRNWSNPPAHGPLVVQTILGDDGLRAAWLDELAQMRNRINSTRALLRQTLNDAGVTLGPDDNAFITRQNGMFTMSGLTPEQVDRLRSDHAIYIVRSGRINVAGITERNVGTLAAAIAQVV